jgi:hypothetical protein
METNDNRMDKEKLRKRKEREMRKEDQGTNGKMEQKKDDEGLRYEIDYFLPSVSIFETVNVCMKMQIFWGVTPR